MQKRKQKNHTRTIQYIILAITENNSKMESNTKVNSLMVTTHSVLKLLEGLDRGKAITPIDIAGTLDLPPRRVYDILSILETASVVRKERKQYSI